MTEKSGTSSGSLQWTGPGRSPRRAPHHHPQPRDVFNSYPARSRRNAPATGNAACLAEMFLQIGQLESNSSAYFVIGDQTALHVGVQRSRADPQPFCGFLFIVETPGIWNSGLVNRQIF